MKKNVLIILVVCLLLALGLIFDFTTLISANRTVIWNAPSTNVDGSPITDLAGYKVYCDSTMTDVGNAVEYTLSKSCQVVYVTAYDTSGNESEPSNQLDTMTPGKVTIRFR